MRRRKNENFYLKHRLPPLPIREQFLLVCRFLWLLPKVIIDNGTPGIWLLRLICRSRVDNVRVELLLRELEKKGLPP